MYALATLYSMQSRFGDAEKLLREELNARQRLMGPDHGTTCRSRNRLARVLIQEGRSSEAVKLLEPALPKQRSARPDAESTLNSAMFLAHAYSLQGRLNEAEKLSREVLEVRRRVSGPQHPETLNAMWILGTCLGEAKRYAEAAKVLREELEGERRVFGTDHPNVMGTHNNLADVYKRDHRYAEADREYRAALAIAHRLYGDKDLCAPGITCTGAAIYNLACLAALEGKRQDAIATLRQAVEHGFRDPDQMAKDDELKSLHGDSRFEAIVTKLRQQVAK